MVTDAYGISPKQLLSVTVAQCLVQGLLISLFITFLSIRSTRPPAFTVYVTIINLFCMGQTTISVVQTADLLDPRPYRESLVLAFVVFTVAIGTGVQAFFVERCWKIFKKRVLPTIPLVLLSLVGLAAGVLLVVFKAQFTEADLAYQANPQGEALNLAFEAAQKRSRIALTIWAFSWFILELGMTVITVVFLYRVRTGVPEHNGIFCTVGQVLCTSFSPPFILMSIVIIDGYVTPGNPSAVSKIAVSMTAKSFALSLMINLIGQGHIREKFMRAQPAPSNRPGIIISDAVFATGVISLGSPNAEDRESISDIDSTRVDSWEGHHELEGDIEKREIPTTPPADHSTQLVRVSS